MIPLPIVVATARPKKRKEMKLKKAAQSDRQLRAQHPGRDHGRDRIGGVVQAVQEIERERDADQRDDDEGVAVHQAWSITMPWISSATSSKPSSTRSRWR